MKHWGLYIFLFLLSLESGLAQEIFQTKNARISFYSSAPVEDIMAVSREGSSLYNAATGEIIFKVRMRSFEFDKDLMREHFNENYVESHKYPEATFRGVISPVPDPGSTNDQEVLFKGDLEVHGRTRPREIPGTITISGDYMNIKTKFDVANEDHDIKIPRLMFRNIAEVIKVTVDAHYTKRGL